MPKKAFRWTRAANRKHLRESLENFRRVGFTHFRLLSAHDGRDCPACVAMDGPTFPVDAPPPFPPADCWCQPYGCRLCAIVA